MPQVRTSLVVAGFVATLVAIVVLRPDAPSAVASGPSPVLVSRAATDAEQTAAELDNTDRLPMSAETIAGINPDLWRASGFDDGESLVATVIDDGVLTYDAPDGGAPTHWFPHPTQFGGDRVFMVVQDDPNEDRIEVLLPTRPNGRTGWVSRDEVEISTVAYRATVNLSNQTVTVWSGDQVVVTAGAVIGAEATPTPVGAFYLTEVVPQEDSEGFYGPHVLALSGFSETLDSYAGGEPALALHGTDQPDQIGEALSAGCVRVTNDVIELLAETVPPGSPVVIVS